MPVPFTKDEIQKMRKACQHAARALEHVIPFVKAGITTNELDAIVHDYTLRTGAKPACLGYQGYPKTICTSVNDVVCHGLPDETKLLDGDIINIDITSLLDGFYGDTSATIFVGPVSDRAKAITECAYDCMMKGIEAITPHGTTGDIGFVVNKLATRKGYTTVKEIGGHGIGKKFHDEPFVPSFGKKGKGDPLLPWTCITVEPMINETAAKLVELPIAGSKVKWYHTADRCLSAQFEHTILITDEAYEILTVPSA